MTKYLQTNPEGYIISIVDEPIPNRQEGRENYSRIPDTQTKGVAKLLEAMRLTGSRLHIDDVVIPKPRRL